MNSWFMVEMHWPSRKPLSSSLLECASLPGLRTFQLRHPGTSSQTQLLAAYMIMCLSLTHQVSCVEVPTYNVHVAWLCYKICLLLSLSTLSESELWGALGQLASPALQSLTRNWVLPCSGPLSPLLFMTLLSPLLIGNAKHRTRVQQAQSFLLGCLWVIKSD